MIAIHLGLAPLLAPGWFYVGSEWRTVDGIKMELDQRLGDSRCPVATCDDCSTGSGNHTQVLANAFVTAYPELEFLRKLEKTVGQLHVATGHMDDENEMAALRLRVYF